MSQIISRQFNGRNAPIDLYEVAEKFKCNGHVFLSLKFAGQDFPPTLTIAFLADGNEKMSDYIDVSDKIEFTPLKCTRFGWDIRKHFFDNEHPALMVTSVKLWKPNVVSLEGWKNLQKPQTRFKRRGL